MAQVGAGFTHRDLCGLRFGESVNSGTDGGECNGARGQVFRQCKRRAIAAGQQLSLAAAAAMPHWADGVNHVLRL